MAFFDSIKSPRNGLFASFTPGNLIFFISTYPFPILFLYICKTSKINMDNNRRLLSNKLISIYEKSYNYNIGIFLFIFY